MENFKLEIDEDGKLILNENSKFDSFISKIMN